MISTDLIDLLEWSKSNADTTARSLGSKRTAQFETDTGDWDNARKSATQTKTMRAHPAVAITIVRRIIIMEPWRRAVWQIREAESQVHCYAATGNRFSSH